MKLNKNIESFPPEKVITPWAEVGQGIIGLVYPNTYALGISNLGFHQLVSILSTETNLGIRRYFWEKDQTYSPDNFFSPINADILAFSVAYENDYQNILNFLLQNGIPLLSEDRQNRHPLLIAGGAAITNSPRFLRPIMDLMFLGELEPVASQFGQSLSKVRNLLRKAFINELKQIPGIWTYEQEYLTKPLPRALNLDKNPAFSTTISSKAVFADMFLIEANRGCSFQCKFCSVGNNGGKLRFLNKAKIYTIIKEKAPNIKKIGLIGAAIGAHSDLIEIISYLQKQDKEISISSLRADNVTKTLLESLKQSGQRTITLAPEVGAESQRKLLGKPINNDVFMQTAEWAGEIGIEKIKLYFVINLPLYEDFAEESKDLLTFISEFYTVFSKNNPHRKVTVALSPFVPRPFTPWEKAIIPKRKYVTNLLKKIKTGLSPFWGIEITPPDLTAAFMEAYFASADEKECLSLIRELETGTPVNYLLRKRTKVWIKKLV